MHRLVANLIKAQALSLSPLNEATDFELRLAFARLFITQHFVYATDPSKNPDDWLNKLWFSKNYEKGFGGKRLVSIAEYQLRTDGYTQKEFKDFFVRKIKNRESWQKELSESIASIEKIRDSVRQNLSEKFPTYE